MLSVINQMQLHVILQLSRYLTQYIHKRVARSQPLLRVGCGDSHQLRIARAKKMGHASTKILFFPLKLLTLLQLFVLLPHKLKITNFLLNM